MAYTYQFDISGRRVIVDMDREGEARYMVRMDEGRGRIRIGYLLGARRTWVAEFYGRPRRTEPAKPSAKAACRAMAEWAIGLGSAN